MLESREKLSDYTLVERIADLTAEMVLAGATLVCVVDDTLEFNFAMHGHEKPVRVTVRIMLNQWDVYIAGGWNSRYGCSTVEQGHAHSDAASVAAWGLHTAQLHPKHPPPCQGIVEGTEDERCNSVNAEPQKNGRWLCCLCQEVALKAAGAIQRVQLDAEPALKIDDIRRWRCC